MYQNAKIYKITCYENNLIYYGSTTRTLKQRLQNHKINYKRFLKNKRNNVMSFDIVKYDSCKIELVENYPCQSKKELSLRERYYIENNECCNKQIPGRTRKEYMRMYRAKPENKEKIRQQNKKTKDKNKEKNRPNRLIQNKKYYEKNKQKILEKQNAKYTCICGSILSKGNKAQHEKSNKHLTFLNH